MRVPAPKEDSALGGSLGVIYVGGGGETGDAEHLPREIRFWGRAWRRGGFRARMAKYLVSAEEKDESEGGRNRCPQVRVRKTDKRRGEGT